MLRRSKLIASSAFATSGRRFLAETPDWQTKACVNWHAHPYRKHYSGLPARGGMGKHFYVQFFRRYGVLRVRTEDQSERLRGIEPPDSVRSRRRKSCAFFSTEQSMGHKRATLFSRKYGI